MKAIMWMLVKTFLVVSMVIQPVMMHDRALGEERVSGCYYPADSACTNHTLICPVTEHIYISDLYYLTKPPPTTCPRVQDKNECESSPCCTKSTDDTEEPMSGPDSLLVYKNCSYQQSCSITSPFPDNNGYHYIDYYYFCEREKRVHNIMTTTTLSGESLFSLYYSGKDLTIKGLTCSCDIFSSRGDDISIYLYYIYLSGESCNRVTVTRDDEPVYTCKDDEVFIGYNSSSVNNKARIMFNNMVASNDDVIWLGFLDSYYSIEVECDCRATDGSWSNWSEYDSCSVSCGGGSKTRTRKCDNPAPANGGSNCSGKAIRSTMCNQQLQCPVKYDLYIWILIGVAVVIFLVFITWCVRRKTKLGTSMQKEPPIQSKSISQEKTGDDSNLYDTIAEYESHYDTIGEQVPHFDTTSEQVSHYDTIDEQVSHYDTIDEQESYYDIIL